VSLMAIVPPRVASSLLLVLDVTGTFVFALSGAISGVEHRLDIFGVLVLSFAAATAGGIARDVLIGAIPPVAFQDWHYLFVCILAGLLTFYWYPVVRRLRSPMLMFDAAGLALFAVVGTLKALEYELGPVAAAAFGMLTGVGGGVLRDLLVVEVPTVLRSQFYALAALAGSVVVAAGKSVGLPTSVVAAAGATLCFVLRFLAIRRGWNLPQAQPENLES
jgi:uncharacterized membrane protein YeiH